MREVIVAAGREIDIGRHGEHLATCVKFDISEWVSTYGEGTAQVMHQRNGDDTAYPCEITREGNTVTWIVTQYDVGVAGRGRAELQYYVGDALVKSEIFTTSTDRSLYRSTAEVPAPYYEALKTARMPTLTKEQQDQIFDLAYNQWYKQTMGGDSQFMYYGNINRNKYAYPTIYRKNGEEYRVTISCNCWAMLVWAGIKPETFPKNKDEYTAKIEKAFDWGHWFRFPFLYLRDTARYKDDPEKPYGFVQPDENSLEGSYSYTSYYNPNSSNKYKQSFPSMMNGDHMALELRLTGFEVPISEAAVGDMVFFGARDLNDGSDDEREEHDFLNITHCGIIYAFDEVSGLPKIIDCTNVNGVNKPIVLTKAEEDEPLVLWFKARAYDLYKRIVMVARHPAALGKQNPVPEYFYDMTPSTPDDDDDPGQDDDTPMDGQ